MASANVQENHSAALDASQWNIGFGPVTLAISFDPTVPQVTVSATLVGQSIGSATLNRQNTSATIGGSVFGQKAEVILTADFDSKTLSIDVELDTFGIHKSIKKSITL